MLLSDIMAAALAHLSVGAENAKNYTFETVGTSQEVQVGQKGDLKLLIKASPGFHVSPDAPLKIGLAAEDGLELTKKQLDYLSSWEQGT